MALFTAQTPQPDAHDTLVEEKEPSATDALENWMTLKDMGRAMERLKSVLKPYLPLHRQPGKWHFQGADLVLQDEEEKSFNDVGYVLLAARTLSIWEKVVGEKLRSRIGKIFFLLAVTPLIQALETLNHADKEKQGLQEPANTSGMEFVSPQKLMEPTLPHQPPSQAIAHALTLSKDQQGFQKHAVLGKGLVFTKEVYLRRLELENLAYRKHLHDFEQGLYTNVLAEVSKVLNLDEASSDAPAKAAAKISRVLSTPSKQPTTNAKATSAIERKALNINSSQPAVKRKAKAQKAKQAANKRRRWNASPKKNNTSHAKPPSNADEASPKSQDKPKKCRKPSPVIVDLTEMASKTSTLGSSASSNTSSKSANDTERRGDA